MTAAKAAGQVITFYSYKGGTGRSMAMANIACLLARRAVAEDAKPVLAIDWDLEAPGLHRYFDRAARGLHLYFEPVLPRQARDRPGLLDLLYDVRAQLPPSVAEGERESAAKQLVDAIELDRYVERTDFPKLSFLRAGRFDDDYGTRTNTFSWTSFYETVPAFFRLFAHRLAREYSFVLVDSRTGVTDISGICTMLLPEKLVVVFTPNRQSLTGVTDLVRRADAYRRSSRDPRPLTIFPLPSRIDTSFPDLMKLWRMGGTGVAGWQSEFTSVLQDVYDLDDEEAERIELYFDSVQLPHVAQYAFGEKIAVLDERTTDKLTIANSYVALRDSLVRGAPWAGEESAEPAEAAELHRKIVLLENQIGASTAPPAPSPPAAAAPRRSRWRLGVAAILLAGLAIPAVSAFRSWRARESSQTLLAGLLKPEAAEIDRPTYALLLLEAIPGLRGNSQDLAVRRLRETLSTMPRTVLRADVTSTLYGSSPYVDFSQSGKRMLLHDAKSVQIWDTASGRRLWQREMTVASARFSGPSEDTIVTIAGDRLDVWAGDKNVQSSRLPYAGTLRLTRDGEYVVAIDTDGVTLAAVDGILGRRGFMPIRLLVALVGTALEVERFLYWGMVIGEREIALCDRTRANVMIVPVGKPSKVAQVSGDRKWLAVTDSDDKLHIYDLASGKPIETSPVRADNFGWSGDARSILITRSGEPLTLIERSSGRILRTAPTDIKRDAKFIDSVGDGRFIVEYADEAVFLTPHLRTQLRIPPTSGFLVFSDTHDRMAVVGSDSIILYDINPAALPESAEALQQATCGRVGRTLTREEWAAYLPDRDYAPRCGKAPAE